MSHPSTQAVAFTPVLDLQPDLAPATQAAFVQVLAQWGNVRAAAAQVGVSRAHLYRMRRACPEFRTLWDTALVMARPQVEEVLADRALNGVQESVFYHGEEIAVRTRYDSRLLLAHLARLDRIEGDHAVYMALRDFDRRVAQLADPPRGEWEDEDEYEEEASDDQDDGADDAAADTERAGEEQASAEAASGDAALTGCEESGLAGDPPASADPADAPFDDPAVAAGLEARADALAAVLASADGARAAGRGGSGPGAGGPGDYPSRTVSHVSPTASGSGAGAGGGAGFGASRAVTAKAASPAASIHRNAPGIPHHQSSTASTAI